jgi:actin-related protein
MWQNIVATGGWFRQRGSLTRLKSELTALLQEKKTTISSISSSPFQLHTVADQKPMYSAITGARILASSRPLSQFVTLEEYREVGASVIRRKFL